MTEYITKRITDYITGCITYTYECIKNDVLQDVQQNIDSI